MPGDRRSAVEATLAALETIDREDRRIRAFTAVDPELALAGARAVDERIATGLEGPLAGVPIAVKDLIDVEGLPSTYGTEAIRPRVASHDAFCVARLREAGAVIVGKTRTSELAWRGDTPPTENPRFPGLVPGGSSGGSGAAVAAGFVPLALGTDTGGSVRWPAAMCGVVGLKPTLGAVSLAGVLPCSFELDHVGPIAGSVADARAALVALLAHDPSDPRSAARSFVEPLGARLEQPEVARDSTLRLGVIDEPLFAIADDDATAFFEQTIVALESEGVAVVHVRLLETSLVAPSITAISLADGVLFAEALRDRAAELSNEVRAQLQLAHVLPAAIVDRARGVRRLVAARTRNLFREHRLDALLLPATTAPPVRRDALDAEIALADGKRKPALAFGVRTFYLANLTGQPALVVPARVGDRPLAIQLAGRPFEDDRLLEAGAILERLLGGPAS